MVTSTFLGVTSRNIHVSWGHERVQSAVTSTLPGLRVVIVSGYIHVTGVTSVYSQRLHPRYRGSRVVTVSGCIHVTELGRRVRGFDLVARGLKEFDVGQRMSRLPSKRCSGFQSKIYLAFVDASQLVASERSPVCSRLPREL